MNWQAALLEPAILAALASRRSTLFGNRTSATRILVILATCLGFVAALFLLGWSYMWLQHYYNAEDALLITAGVATSFSVVALVAAWGIAHYKRIRLSLYQKHITNRIEAMASALLEEFEGPVRSYPKSAVAIAGLVGYLASNRIQDGTDLLIQAFDKLRS